VCACVRMRVYALVERGSCFYLDSMHHAREAGDIHLYISVQIYVYICVCKLMYISVYICVRVCVILYVCVHVCTSGAWRLFSLGGNAQCARRR